MNIFQKILEAIKNFLSRPGLKTFLAKYDKIAIDHVAKLAKLNSNLSFHEWKDQAFEFIKQESNQAKDNWIAILIHLAYEQFKATQLEKTEGE